MGVTRDVRWTVPVVTLALVVVSAHAFAQRQARPRRPQAAPAPAQDAPPDAVPTPPGGNSESPDRPQVLPEAQTDLPVTVDGAPSPASPVDAEGPVDAADLTALRDEYSALMDDLVETRARIAALGRQLFQTRIQIRLLSRVGDEYIPDHVALRLDGGPIARLTGSDVHRGRATQVFDGFAAQGPHLLAVEVDQRARGNDAYRYRLEDEFRFEVVRGKTTEITITLDDDSGIAEDFPDDEEGEYDVRTRVRVATRDTRTR